MFFSKNKPLDAKELVDIHVHILPGIDDGPGSLEESIEMAKVAKERGVSAIIATPHANRTFSNGKTLIEKKTTDLNKALKEANIEIEVYPGVEYRVSPDILSELEDGSLQTLANSQYLLIELPFTEVPFYMEELVFQLKLKGLTPILAHPERTSAIQEQFERLERLVAQGCLIQVNAQSIGKRFGPERTTALKIIKSGMAFAIASDGHDAFKRPPMFGNALNYTVQLLGEERALSLVRDNPARIIRVAGPDTGASSCSAVPARDHKSSDL